MSKPAMAISGAVLAGSIVAGVGVGTAWLGTKETQICTVVDKESIARESGHTYRIYTEECGVLAAEDSPWLLHFNSADVYAQLEPGQAYSMDTIGWRNGFFSLFPNVVEARNV